MKLDTDPTQRQQIYDTYLKDISGIKFTIREIDVISCVFLHSSDETSLASLLSISCRTIDSHIRNITGKLGGGSRASIIRLISKSNKLQYIRNYYFHLVVELLFEKSLQRIASTVNRSEMTCTINFNKSTEYEEDILKWIIRHLKFANINLVSNNKLEKNTSYNFRIVGSELLQNNENLKNNIILLCNKKFDLASLSGLRVVSFQEVENYYNSVFELLGLIIKKDKLIPIINGFEKDYQHILDSLKGNKVAEILGASMKEDRIGSNKFLYIAIICILSSCCAYFILYHNTQPILETNMKTDILSEKTVCHTKSWNLPQYLDNYTMRSEITNELWSKFLNRNEENGQTVVLAGLHGLGGIGKTTLAKNAILHPRQEYIFKGWFSAESKDLLQADYLELGEKENLFNKNMSTKQKIILVKEWLEKQPKTLLVYDNAPDMEVLEEYLPNRGDIIITSRNHKLPGAIEMDVMKEEEAISLLDALMPESIKQSQNYIQELKTLSKMLSYLPLALSQAGAYISEHSLTTEEYLVLYSSEKDKLLSDTTMPAMDQHQPAYISWDISIKKLQEQIGGDKALQALDLIACCYPEHIPKKLLAQYLYDNTDSEAIVKLNKTLSLLKKYSLVKTSSNTVSVHRLVHAWCNSKLNKTMKLELIKNIIPVITTSYPLKNKTNEDMAFMKLLLPHAESVLTQISAFANGNEYVDLMHVLGDTYYFLGVLKKSQSLIEQALAISTKYFGNDNIKTIKLKEYQGNIYLGIGDFTKATEIIEETLSDKKKYYGSEHVEISYTLELVSRAYTRLGDYQKAKELLEKALIIKKKHFDTDHIEIAHSLHYLGKTYLYIGNYVKAKEFLEKAISIKNNYFSDNHLDTAYSLYLLGQTYLNLGDYVKAKTILEKSYKINEEFYGDEHIETTNIMSSLGWYYIKLGEYQKAESLIKKSATIINKLYGVDNMFSIKENYSLANIYRLLKKYEQSKKLLEESLALMEKSHSHDKITIAMIKGGLGLLYGQMNDASKKKEYLESALDIFKENLSAEHPYIKQTSDSLNSDDGSNNTGYLVILSH